MSRVARRKAPTTPVKAARRRDSGSSSGSVSSSLDLSDDEDGYSGVEDITDSDDDDEEDVNAVEEKHILREDSKPVESPRPQSFDFDRDDRHYDDEVNDDDEDQDQAVEGEAYESTSWAGIASDTDEKQVSDFYQEATFGSDLAVERHVRFDLPSSDSDSTDTEDDHADLFPDIFVSQNSLDPSFRREIEHDPDESSDSGSFWDFNPYTEPLDSDAEGGAQDDDATPTATPRTTQNSHDLLLATPVTVDEPNEMDGYETDGDTTEEDIPEPPVRRKSRRPSVAQSEFSDSEDERPVKQQRGQPRLGSFNLDRSEKKPIAVLNPHTRKMMIFTPHRRRQLDLSPEQFNLAWNAEVQSSPLVNTSANLMFNAMFSSNTFGDFLHGPPLDASDPFFTTLSSGGHLADESSSIPSGLEDGDDEEQKLDISDFIAWDDDNLSAAGDDNDKGKKKEWGSGVAEPSSEPDTLSHLNSQTVGAFRRNQINQQLILSNQATQDSLAFSGPYNYMALKGLKSDRFDGAGLPLTPMRRHKKQRSDVTRSPLESASAKRKASSDVQNGGHKKQRSISDVNYLHI